MTTRSLLLVAPPLLVAAACGGASGSTGAGGATTTTTPGSTSTEPASGGGSSSSNTSSSSSSSGGGGGAGGAAPGGACDPLPPPSGNVIAVAPSDAGKLQALAYGAKDGDTLLLDDGTYHLGGAYLQFVAGATLRSKSGDPTKVILDGDWQSSEIVQIAASHATIADVTLARAVNHPIHVVSTPSGDTVGTLIYHVIVLDPGEQGIKINADGSGHHVDGGTVACSTIQLTDDGRQHVMNNCYTGGVDAHDAEGWVVRDNHIDGFYCSQGLSEHGVHFWTGCRGTVVERNVITNCARGIGFGLGQGTQNRTYADGPCPGVASAGHYLGVIRNNFVAAFDPALFASASGFDTGIGLEDACGAVVAHNTVSSTSAPFASIDVRFPHSNPILANNLVTHGISLRDGASPASSQGNVEMAPASLFAAPDKGDLHLVAGASAIDQGSSVAGAPVPADIDGQTRDQKPDIGADERAP